MNTITCNHREINKTIFHTKIQQVKLIIVTTGVRSGVENGSTIANNYGAPAKIKRKATKAPSVMARPNMEKT
jgi:hypothetical protein